MIAFLTGDDEMIKLLKKLCYLIRFDSQSMQVSCLKSNIATLIAILCIGIIYLSIEFCSYIYSKEDMSDCRTINIVPLMPWLIDKTD